MSYRLTTNEYMQQPAHSATPWMGSAKGGAVAVADLNMTINAARMGDESAFSALVHQYQSAAERVAQHILRTEEAAICVARSVVWR